MLLVLFALGSFGLLTSTVFAGMVLAGARNHLRNSETPSNAFTPPLSLLKPLHGDEPGLEANLATFFEQDYPASAFELLFCAREEQDAGLAIARRVAGRYPNVPTKILWTNGEPPYINAKVASLLFFKPKTAYDILVISDSDVRVTRD